MGIIYKSNELLYKTGTIEYPLISSGFTPIHYVISSPSGKFTKWETDYRTVMIPVKPNTKYIITKDTKSVMRVSAGGSILPKSGTELRKFVSGNTAVEFTTTHDECVMYIQLYISNDPEELRDINIHLPSLSVVESNPDEEEVSVLIIGNSFSFNEFDYMGEIIKTHYNNTVNVKTAILYDSGQTLDKHYEKFVNNANYTYRYDYSSVTGKITRKSNYPALDVLNEKWDVIILMQGSNDLLDYSKYSKINPLIKLISEKLMEKNYSTLFGFNVPHIWGINDNRLDKGTGATRKDKQIDIYNKVIELAKRVERDTDVDFVLYNCTSIQNARTTTLAELGEGSDLCYDSGTMSHLQQGIGYYIPALYNAMRIMAVIGKQKKVFGNTIRPTDEYLNNLYSPSTIKFHGESIGVDDSNLLLAQRCVMQAIKNPYEITNCSEQV